MSYGELYTYCQGLDVPVSRAAIKKKVCELTGTEGIKLFLDGLNVGKARGYYVSARNTEHPFVKQNQCRALIVVARDLNYCWQRFVVVKELMHLFDDPLQSLGSGDEFLSLLNEFGTEQPNRSPAMQSEVFCVWLAMAVLCPEALRQELQVLYARGELTSIQVATRLMIPEQMVTSMMSPSYKSIMTKILGFYRNGPGV